MSGDDDKALARQFVDYINNDNLAPIDQFFGRGVRR